MAVQPELRAFAEAYDAGRPQVVWTTLVADLETPVSAMLKIGAERPYSFLFESVEGGAVRGRYSAIGLKPDLVWRCFGRKSEINRQARHDLRAFVPSSDDALNDLRALIRSSRIPLPPELPPMAAGLFGYLGYDTVRLMERLPDGNPDVLGIPDAVFVRPTVVAIFDNIQDQVVIVAPVWPSAEHTARAAYDLARERLADVVADFDRGLPHRSLDRAPVRLPDARSNVSRERYHEMVSRAKEYILAGDIFQVVPSQRFELDFDLSAFQLYRALRRLNPSPFLFYLDFDGFSLV
ncbi:MAG: chorismate-binding protein, partial [Geminicoccaceae bacterium]|nr:chorismate-binding protein [Geminicoccaceae bacterium]